MKVQSELAQDPRRHLVTPYRLVFRIQVIQTYTPAQTLNKPSKIQELSKSINFQKSCMPWYRRQGLVWMIHACPGYSCQAGIGFLHQRRKGWVVSGSCFRKSPGKFLLAISDSLLARERPGTQGSRAGLAHASTVWQGSLTCLQNVSHGTTEALFRGTPLQRGTPRLQKDGQKKAGV